MRVPLTAYAKMRGVHDNSIRTAIKAGEIERGADGKVSVEQADETWYAGHQARLNGHEQNRQGESRLVRAKVASGVVKAQLARHRLQEMTGSHVDRSDVASSVATETRAILTMLQTVADRRAGELAATVGVSVAVARSMLDRLLAQVLDELADIEDELAAAVQRL